MCQNCKKPCVLLGIVLILLSAILCACAGVGYEERPAGALRFMPHWAADHGIAEQSRITLVQGLPGYSLIAGKDTLVSFSPMPGGMRTDEDTAWLDVYQVEGGQRTEPPVISHLSGDLVGYQKQCDYWGDHCAEMNFFIAGESLSAPGDYLFVVSWHHAKIGQIVDNVLVRFHAPAVVKVLFVPINMDVFADSVYREFAMRSVQHYFARMPFASNAIDEIGPDSRYWDIYPHYVEINQQQINDASCKPHDLCNLFDPVYDAYVDYNGYASVKADIVVGLFFTTGFGCGGAGCSSGIVALCDLSYEGICTHEIGHVISPTEESVDSYASEYTCGYFSDDDDATASCRDWAYDSLHQAIYPTTDPPMNVMSWDGGTERGFFTRHFYEAACIEYHGGCESLQPDSFWLKSLDGSRYLHADSRTGEVRLIVSEDVEAAKWWFVEANAEYNYHSILLLSTDESCLDCTSTLLIRNPSSGELKTVDPGDFYDPNQADQYGGWKDDWEIEQLAMDIVTLNCYYEFLIWGDAEPWLPFGEPESRDQEHWLPQYQWRVIR